MKQTHSALAEPVVKEADGGPPVLLALVDLVIEVFAPERARAQ